MCITYPVAGAHEGLNNCIYCHEGEVMVTNHLPSLVFFPLQSPIDTRAYISMVSSGYGSA